MDVPFLRVQRINGAVRPARRLAAVSGVNPAFAPDAFPATIQMACFEGFLRDIADIRLPFVAFGGSV
ncbi:hypothetical protein CIW50_21265 [Tardiphaga sp. P9-11]|nr:hypothetical protein CIW50_21265 [Tardiphaga sp. P9-11]